MRAVDGRDDVLACPTYCSPPGGSEESWRVSWLSSALLRLAGGPGGARGGAPPRGRDRAAGEDGAVGLAVGPVVVAVAAVVAVAVVVVAAVMAAAAVVVLLSAAVAVVVAPPEASTSTDAAVIRLGVESVRRERSRRRRVRPGGGRCGLMGGVYSLAMAVTRKSAGASTPACPSPEGAGQVEGVLKGGAAPTLRPQ